MLVRKILAFLIGVAYSSCWWQLAVNSYVVNTPNGEVGLAWMIPAFGTLFMIAIAAMNFAAHWEDKS